MLYHHHKPTGEKFLMKTPATASKRISNYGMIGLRAECFWRVRLHCVWYSVPTFLIRHSIICCNRIRSEVLFQGFCRVSPDSIRLTLAF